MRVCAALITFLIVATATSYADDAAVQPTRFIVIRAWRGDTLTIMTQVPLMPGHPATISSGDGGLPVPEGMVPPPMKVSSLISVRIAGSADTVRYGTLDQTDAALANGNHFVVGDVEIRILEKDADRFAAVLFDADVPAEQALALPEEVAFGDEDRDFLPDAAITAWVSGSLAPMMEQVLIDRSPEKPSITLPNSDD
jgi:hypothetical protein